MNCNTSLQRKVTDLVPSVLCFTHETRPNTARQAGKRPRAAKSPLPHRHLLFNPCVPLFGRRLVCLYRCVCVCVFVCIWSSKCFFWVILASAGFNFHHSWLPFDQLSHLSVCVTSKKGSVLSCVCRRCCCRLVCTELKINGSSVEEMV